MPKRGILAPLAMADVRSEDPRQEFFFINHFFHRDAEMLGRRLGDVVVVALRVVSRQAIHACLCAAVPLTMRSCRDDDVGPRGAVNKLLHHKSEVRDGDAPSCCIPHLTRTWARRMTSLSKTGMPGPDAGRAHALSQYYNGHHARR